MNLQGTTLLVPTSCLPLHGGYGGMISGVEALVHHLPTQQTRLPLHGGCGNRAKRLFRRVRLEDNAIAPELLQMHTSDAPGP
jgi:hypothetical protein